MVNTHPKIMFKVELLNKSDVKFTLLQISNHYTSNKKNSKFYFTKNNWTIYHGKNFIINKKDVITFPDQALRQTSKVIFKTDEERYKFMKELARALTEWSGSHIFNGSKLYNGKPSINFHKSIWVIF